MPVPKVGDQVMVFNQVGDNWIGTVQATTKKSARVHAKYFTFTHHRDAHEPHDNGQTFTVPFSDILETLKP